MSAAPLHATWSIRSSIARSCPFAAAGTWMCIGTVCQPGVRPPESPPPGTVRLGPCHGRSPPVASLLGDRAQMDALGQACTDIWRSLRRGSGRLSSGTTDAVWDVCPGHRALRQTAEVDKHTAERPGRACECRPDPTPPGGPPTPPCHFAEAQRPKFPDSRFAQTYHLG